MYLTNYMNSHSNWQIELAAEPYYLKVKQDGEYWMVEYNLLASDFTQPEVLEARGSIFRVNDNGEWICVCRALDKFGNYGESYAATKYIDWNLGVSVQEKIDGSLIKLWCDRGLWRISTNGSIDAFKADCGNSNFGQIFYSIVGKYTSIKNFFQYLNPSYTYWFELVHPLYNHIVVKYQEAAIYYLGCRNMITMEEIGIIPFEIFDMCNWIKYPKRFDYTSLAECIEAAHKLGVDEEGYVVCAYQQQINGSYLRVKVKGDEYLRLHKIRGNGALTTLRVVEMWQTDMLDDFVAYYPEHKNFVDAISFSIHHLISISDIAYNSLKGYPDRKEYALRANTYLPLIKSYLFARLDNKTDCASSWFKSFRAKSLAAFLTEASQEIEKRK